MFRRYLGFFDFADKRYMLFEGDNAKIFYHIPHVSLDNYTVTDDQIVSKVVEELHKHRCVAVETISFEGRLIDVKLNLFTKKFWLINKEDGMILPYQQYSSLYDKYNPIVVSSFSQDGKDSSWENDNSWNFSAMNSEWEIDDSEYRRNQARDAELKRQRRKKKMIISVAAGLVVTLSLSIGTWSFLKSASLLPPVSVQRAEETILTEEMLAFLEDVESIELQLQEQNIPQHLIKRLLNDYVQHYTNEDFLNVYMQEENLELSSENVVSNTSSYEDDDVVQMFLNGLNDNPNLTEKEKEFFKTHFVEKVFEYKDKISPIDLINDVYTLRIVYTTAEYEENGTKGEKVEGTYNYKDNIITIYETPSFDAANSIVMSHEFNHLLLGHFMSRYKWVGEGYTALTNPITDNSYARERLMLIGYLEIFGKDFFEECFYDFGMLRPEDFEFFETYFEPVNVFLEKHKNNELTLEDRMNMANIIRECYSQFRGDDFECNPVMNVCNDFIMGTNTCEMFDTPQLPCVSLRNNVLEFSNVRYLASYKSSNGFHSASIVDPLPRKIALSDINSDCSLVR